MACHKLLLHSVPQANSLRTMGVTALAALLSYGLSVLSWKFLNIRWSAVDTHSSTESGIAEQLRSTAVLSLHMRTMCLFVVLVSALNKLLVGTDFSRLGSLMLTPERFSQ